MNYTECALCGCTPKPDEWSAQVENCCFDCGINRYEKAEPHT